MQETRGTTATQKRAHFLSPSIDPWTDFAFSWSIACQKCYLKPLSHQSGTLHVASGGWQVACDTWHGDFRPKAPMLVRFKWHGTWHATWKGTTWIFHIQVACHVAFFSVLRQDWTSSFFIFGMRPLTNLLIHWVVTKSRKIPKKKKNIFNTASDEKITTHSLAGGSCAMCASSRTMLPLDNRPINITFAHTVEKYKCLYDTLLQ